MYYEEKQIDGIWHFRCHPKDEWKVMGSVRLKEKIRLLEKENPELFREIIEQAYMQGQADEGIDPSYSNARNYYDSLFV